MSTGSLHLPITTTSKFLSIPRHHIEIDVTVVDIKDPHRSSRYGGPAKIVKMADADGNILVWVSNTATAKSLKEHDKIRISAIVKRHQEYNGVNQTHVKNCKIL